jgi:hypothetical protein
MPKRSCGLGWQRMESQIITGSASRSEPSDWTSRRPLSATPDMRSVFPNHGPRRRRRRDPTVRCADDCHSGTKSVASICHFKTTPSLMSGMSDGSKFCFCVDWSRHSSKDEKIRSSCAFAARELRRARWPESDLHPTQSGDHFRDRLRLTISLRDSAASDDAPPLS